MADVFSHIVSVDKQLENNLAGFFWFRISQEVAGKLRAEAAIIWSLARAGDSASKTAHSQTCRQEAWVSHRQCLYEGLLECPPNMADGFLESKSPKRRIKTKAAVPFYDPAETHHHFYFSLLIKSESLTPAHTQGKTRLCCLKGRVSKHSWTHFQNYQRWDRLKYIYDLILFSCAKSVVLCSF